MVLGCEFRSTDSNRVRRLIILRFSLIMLPSKVDVKLEIGSLCLDDKLYNRRNWLAEDLF